MGSISSSSAAAVVNPSMFVQLVGAADTSSQYSMMSAIVMPALPLEARAPHSGCKLAAPKSDDEQIAVEKAAREATTDLIWLGGRFNMDEKRWEWDDGAPIEGYANWDSPEDAPVVGPEKPWLCMHKRTGKWLVCRGQNEFFDAVCVGSLASRKAEEARKATLAATVVTAVPKTTVVAKTNVTTPPCIESKKVRAARLALLKAANSSNGSSLTGANTTAFLKARAFAWTLKLQSEREWKKSGNAPSAPEKAFRDNGWISWPDWLGNSKNAVHPAPQDPSKGKKGDESCRGPHGTERVRIAFSARVADADEAAVATRALLAVNTADGEGRVFAGNLLIAGLKHVCGVKVVLVDRVGGDGKELLQEGDSMVIAVANETDADGKDEGEDDEATGGATGAATSPANITEMVASMGATGVEATEYMEAHIEARLCNKTKPVCNLERRTKSVDRLELSGLLQKPNCDNIEPGLALVTVAEKIFTSHLANITGIAEGLTSIDAAHTSALVQLTEAKAEGRKSLDRFYAAEELVKKDQRAVTNAAKKNEWEVEVKRRTAEQVVKDALRVDADDGTKWKCKDYWYADHPDAADAIRPVQMFAPSFMCAFNYILKRDADTANKCAGKCLHLEGCEIFSFGKKSGCRISACGKNNARGKEKKCGYGGIVPSDQCGTRFVPWVLGGGQWVPEAKLYKVKLGMQAMVNTASDNTGMGGEQTDENDAGRESCGDADMIAVGKPIGDPVKLEAKHGSCGCQLLCQNSYVDCQAWHVYDDMCSLFSTSGMKRASPWSIGHISGFPAEGGKLSPWRTIESPDKRCFDIRNNVAPETETILLRKCNRKNPNQQWEYISTTRQVKNKKGLCLEMAQAKNTLQSRPCNPGNPSQQFSYKFTPK